MVSQHGHNCFDCSRVCDQTELSTFPSQLEKHNSPESCLTVPNWPSTSWLPWSSNICNTLQLFKVAFNTAVDLTWFEPKKKLNIVVFYFRFLLCSHWSSTNEPKCVTLKSQGADGCTVLMSVIKLGKLTTGHAAFSLCLTCVVIFSGITKGSWRYSTTDWILLSETETGPYMYQVSPMCTQVNRTETKSIVQ